MTAVFGALLPKVEAANDPVQRAAVAGNFDFLAELLVAPFIVDEEQILADCRHRRGRNERNGDGRYGGNLLKQECRHSIEQCCVGEGRATKRAKAVQIGYIVAVPETIACGRLDFEPAKIILDLEVMTPGLIDGAAEDVVADFVPVGAAGGGQCRAFGIGEGRARQILSDRRLLRHQRLPTIDGDGGIGRAIGEMGQDEGQRRALDTVPVENILDAAGSAQVDFGASAKRI